MKKVISLVLLLVLAASLGCAQAQALDGAGRWKHGHVWQLRAGDGQAPIEWIVLDWQEDRALLLSKYALDAKPFHEVEDRAVTWAECTLRAWLTEISITAPSAMRNARGSSR